MLRILELITSATWGGAQQQMMAIALAARERGHEVVIACGGEGDLVEQVLAAALPLVKLRWLRGPVHPVADLAAPREIAALIRRLKPDLVHTHSSKAGVVGRLGAGLQAGGRRDRPVVVHHCHGLAWGRGRRQGLAGAAFRWAETLTGSRCDGVICVSAGVSAEVAAARLYPRARQRMLYNAVDLHAVLPTADQATLRHQLGLPLAGQLIAVVARLVPGKGHREVLRAVDSLSRQGYDVHLALAGDGPLEPELKGQVISLPHLKGRVSFLGFCREVPALLRAGNVLCLPSSAEAFGLAAAEAMAAGLPVVATDVSGLNEVVEHGETGLLVPAPATWQHLAGALGTLLRDPQLARRFGERGRLRAAQRFSLQNAHLAVDFLEDVSLSAHGRLPKEA